MKAIGVCFGATTMQVAELSGDPGKGRLATVERTLRVAHEGDPRRAFLEYLASVDFSNSTGRIAVSGRAFRNCVALSSISEPEAVERALAGAYGGNGLPDAVISAGGETQIVYMVHRGGG
ncbi:MAG: hypothetical protein JXA71_03340, partial [Chitinispirillaceae bacterium]|nr:hypothetical protein [Chitinispirillaceae bacterium]